jgi:threonine dehydratase
MDGPRSLVVLGKPIQDGFADGATHTTIDFAAFAPELDAGERAAQLIEERGLTMIHPFDDPFIIAGQGTIGLELFQDLPQVNTVLVPLSGGGLIAGIALALKSTDPDIRVIGVSMERAPVMYHSLKAGRPIQMPEEETLADSLQGGVGQDNQYTYHMVEKYVDDIILVSEEEIATAMAFTFHEEQLVVEGAGAVAMAALLHQKVTDIGRHVVCVVSGGNVDTKLLLEIAQDYQ